MPRAKTKRPVGRDEINLPSSHLARATRLAINLFIIFHVVAIAMWCIPFNNAVFAQGRKIVRPYFLWAGLFQSWDMFSPTPWSINSYVDATVIYHDGSRKNWSFPRTEQMTLTQSLFKERYRKFTENLQLEQNDVLWADVARRIARMNSTAANRVKTVILVQKWSPILLPADGAYQPQPWNQHILYGYGVKPEDLQ
jgi:hypothetical protein